MKTNQEFKNAALAALKGNWAPAVLVAVIYLAIVFLVIAVSYVPVIFPSMATALLAFSGISMLVSVFVRMPFEIGYRYSFLRLYQVGETGLPSLAVDTTLHPYWKNLWCSLLIYIKIFLWSLLLLVPGIVKGLGYGMAPYILCENPEIGAGEAIRRSSAMMKGHRFDLFYLYLSFIGWFILAFFTLGIGFLWIFPYLQTAEAAFYENLKEPEYPIAE